MISSLLAVVLSVPASASASAAPYHGAVLFARDESAWTPVCGLAQRQEILLPLLSRSEAVPRIARGERSARVRIAAASGSALAIDQLRFAWVPHRNTERLVTCAGSNGFWLLGEMQAPRSIVSNDPARPGARDGEERLPWFVRQDGVTGDDTPIDVAMPASKDLRLVLQAAEGRGGGSPIFLVDAHGNESAPRLLLHGRPWEIDLPALSTSADGWVHVISGRIDQIAWARVAPIEVRTQVETAPLRICSASVPSWHRAPARVRQMQWPVIDIPDDALSAVEISDVRTRLADVDRNAWTLAAGAVAEIELPPPPAERDGMTWTLAIRCTSDAIELIEPQPQVAPRDALFRDVTREVGIDMVHMEGPDLELDIRPTMGPGAAWGDIDGDGWVDLFLPQGGGREGSRVPTAKMYRNKHDSTFEDVTQSAHLALQGAGMGALFFDADGDLDLDLFVANYGANRMLINDGAGHFRDVTTLVGVPQDTRWHAAVCAADYDKDGDLDLYITSYLDYDPSKMPPADELGRYQREDPLEMLPFAFPGEHKTLLRNDRIKSVPTEASAPLDSAQNGGPTTPEVPRFHFTDVTDELKVGDPNGRGMQAIWWDFDRDGDQDLYVANDVSPNSFFRNEGNGTFKDISLSTGLDDPRGCMGLAVGDIEGDGDEDLFITNWQLESNALYINNAVAHTSSKSRVSTFRDRAVEAGLAQLSIGVTKWGCELADFDDDGDLDLFYANGYTSPDYESTGICVGQPCHYFEGDGTGKFTPAFEKAGADVALPLASRCALACDHDQDGDLDLVVTANNGRGRLLRNESPRGKSWLGVRLRGRDGNTFAIGAEVRVKIGERLLLRSMRAGTSYLGGNAPELHFGLGDAKSIDELVVRWPDGRETKHAVSALNAFVTLKEGD